MTNLRRFKEAYPDVEVFETTTIIAEGLDPVLYRAADLLETTPQFPLFDETDEEAKEFFINLNLKSRCLRFTTTVTVYGN
ncbi:MAG: hypothetical protein V8S30_02395 [Merdibacter sp.]